MTASTNKEFAAAIRQIASEKGVSEAVIMESVELALVSAFKRHHPHSPEDVTVHWEPGSGQMKVTGRKRVVETVEDPNNQVTPDEARALGWSGNPDEPVEIDITPPQQSFGRIAAQTARGVVMQRLRDAERDKLYEEFANREGEIVTGLLRRQEGKTWIVDLGKVEAYLPPAEQTPKEQYRVGQRLKVYLREVQRGHKLHVTVSRADRQFLRRLFELEVPEIFSGAVEIKNIAREPGTRSKIAVSARQEGVDPVGACVGMRGIRILNIVNELNGEKIDVVPWSPSPAVFVANALSPAQVERVDVDEANRVATVLVPERQLSLAIGKEGQNARLAARLTGWRIDIKNADALRPPRRPVVPDDADENQEMPSEEHMRAVEPSVAIRD